MTPNRLLVPRDAFTRLTELALSFALSFALSLAFQLAFTPTFSFSFALPFPLALTSTFSLETQLSLLFLFVGTCTLPLTFSQVFQLALPNTLALTLEFTFPFHLTLVLPLHIEFTLPLFLIFGDFLFPLTFRFTLRRLLSLLRWLLLTLRLFAWNVLVGGKEEAIGVGRSATSGLCRGILLLQRPRAQIYIIRLVEHNALFVGISSFSLLTACLTAAVPTSTTGHGRCGTSGSQRQGSDTRPCRKGQGATARVPPIDQTLTATSRRWFNKSCGGLSCTRTHVHSRVAVD